MSGMFFLNPENLPEGVREKIEKAHDLHHMSHQQYTHEVNDLFCSLGKEQMVTLHALLSHINGGTSENNEQGAYYIGRLAEHMMIKHGVCTCGVDHDKEAQEMLAQEAAPGPTPNFREIGKNTAFDFIQIMESSLPRSEAQRKLGKMLNDIGVDDNWTPDDIAEATDRAFEVLDTEVYGKNVAAEPEPEPSTPITFTDHAGITHVWKDGQWAAEPQDMAPAPTEPIGEPREVLLKKYNVLDLPVRFPVVVCAKGCGREWSSLTDRMRRAPDKCDGCQQKSAWG